MVLSAFTAWTQIVSKCRDTAAIGDPVSGQLLLIWADLYAFKETLYNTNKE